jgi:quercetin dioxygenase-like cupin family protein
MKSSLIAITTLIATVLAVDKTRDPVKVAKIKSDATQLDKLADLPTNSDWLFDFTAQETYTYSPGSVVNANVATFPALTGTGMTLAMLNLGPCAMLPPHYHPRATNLVVAIEGETTTWMVQENGARVVTETLTPGKMTIFPTASLHTMQNNSEKPKALFLYLSAPIFVIDSSTECTNATLISALNSEDTGTQNFATALWELPDDMIQAAFGNYGAFNNISAIRAKIPAIGTGSVIGSAQCVARCKSQGHNI